MVTKAIIVMSALIKASHIKRDNSDHSFIIGTITFKS